MNRDDVITFDPHSAKNFPSLTDVEIYLGGVGRLCFPDGTEQFAENDTYPDIVYSPRLMPEALEAFCKQNIALYEAHFNLHRRAIAQDDAPAITRFWEQA